MKQVIKRYVCDFCDELVKDEKDLIEVKVNLKGYQLHEDFGIDICTDCVEKYFSSRIINPGMDISKKTNLEKERPIIARWVKIIKDFLLKTR